MTHSNLDVSVKGLNSYFQNRNEPNFALANTISTFLAIPGLIGLWPMSSVQLSTGNAYDISGQSRILTYNGNPEYDFDDLAPYIDLDGTGDWLSRADEADLDVTGTETIYNNPGMTVGGWFWVDVFGTEVLMSKYRTAGNQRAWQLSISGVPQARFIISTDGIATTSVTNTASLSATTWYFIVGRFVPSTGLNIWVNRTVVSNAVGIPASIFNSNTDFLIGARDIGLADLLDGRASMCFFSGIALPVSIINNLYEQSRTLFGV